MNKTVIFNFYHAIRTNQNYLKVLFSKYFKLKKKKFIF